MDNGQKPHLIKNGIRIICNTENFVPIVVPGLSSSSSGSSSTSKTSSRQESHSSSSSSTSSSSPTVGEIQIREQKDGNSSDISPVPVSNSVDDRSGQPEETTIERGNSLNSEIPEWLPEFREHLVDDEIPLQGGSHASSSHEASLEPKRDVRIWVSTVFILISLQTEIAKSVKGPKLQGLHAEDAMAKPYLVLKNLVT